MKTFFNKMKLQLAKIWLELHWTEEKRDYLRLKRFIA
jgi:hypothetical protein